MKKAARGRLFQNQRNADYLLAPAIGAEAASLAEAIGAEAASGAEAIGAGAGAGAGLVVVVVVEVVSSFLPQAARATAATRVAIRSDLFMFVLS
jgi:hypothetical protein